MSHQYDPSLRFNLFLRWKVKKSTEKSNTGHRSLSFWPMEKHVTKISAEKRSSKNIEACPECKLLLELDQTSIEMNWNGFLIIAPCIFLWFLLWRRPCHVATKKSLIPLRYHFVSLSKLNQWFFSTIFLTENPSILLGSFRTCTSVYIHQILEWAF